MPGVAPWPRCRPQTVVLLVQSHATCRNRPHPAKELHGPAAAKRRTDPDLDAQAEGRVVVQERLSRRHAAADDPLGDHGLPARRRAGGDRAVHRREDRHHHRRGTHLGDPRLRALSHHARRRDRHGLHDPREQLHAVDRHRRRLHGRAADLEPRRLHAGHRQDHPVVAHDDVDVRGVDHRRAARLSDEAALHQRGAAAVSGGPRQRRGARRALHGRGAARACSRRGCSASPRSSRGALPGSSSATAG